MNKLTTLSPKITSKQWAYNFASFDSDSTMHSGPTNSTHYIERLNAAFSYMPNTDTLISLNCKGLFDFKKAAAMYFWYKNAGPKDASIIHYFPEYAKCVDGKEHTDFNSNYGLYAYDPFNGIDKCCAVLLKDFSSRQACFMINSNKAMAIDSIDKVCTNAIQYFIRNGKLHCIIQMRSSNILTLLPYDVFMFSVFYFKLLTRLRKSKYYNLSAGPIHIQIASAHFYADDFDKILNSERSKNNGSVVATIFDEAVYDGNWELKLEKFLIEQLNEL